MLKVRVWTLVQPLFLLAVVVGLASPAAAADPSGGPCAVNQICTGVDQPGQPGSTPTGKRTNDAGGNEVCSWNGRVVPCTDPDLGWFSASDGCYYTTSSNAADPAWQGHPAGTGAVYNVTCREADGTLVGKDPVWLAQAPGGVRIPTPAELAQQARESFTLHDPVVHTAPGGTVLVGLSTWLWVTNDQTGGPVTSKPAQAGGVSVVAVARIEGVTWDLGDGTVLACKGGPGTPYEPGSPTTDSPDCSHRFTKSSASQPSSAFSMTATLHWQVTFQVTGSPVQIPPVQVDVASAPAQVRVAEVQVLN